MTTAQFADLQEAFLFSIGPIVAWLLTFLAAGGVISAIGVMFLHLYAKLLQRQI